MIHPIHRARERYDLPDFTQRDLARVRRQLQQKKHCTFLCAAKGGSEIWIVSYKKKTMKVMWNPSLEKILTFLPNEISIRSGQYL